MLVESIREYMQRRARIGARDQKSTKLNLTETETIYRQRYGIVHLHRPRHPTDADVDASIVW